MPGVGSVIGNHPRTLFVVAAGNSGMDVDKSIREHVPITLRENNLFVVPRPTATQPRIAARSWRARWRAL